MQDSSVVLFSGGSDSTLAAAFEAEAGRRVHLLTLDRISFFRTREFTEVNYRNLCRIYGPSRFVREIITIDDLHQIVSYRHYPRIFTKFGFAVAALCFSKISMHWACARYAQKSGVRRVVDGSVPYMSMYPDQNQRIASENLKHFYSRFGIEYATPVYEISESVEEKLFERGITAQPRVRGTLEDKQVFYSEQILLALFLKFYLGLFGIEKYEARMKGLFADRLEMILKLEGKDV